MKTFEKIIAAITTILAFATVLFEILRKVSLYLAIASILLIFLTFVLIFYYKQVKKRRKLKIYRVLFIMISIGFVINAIYYVRTIQRHQLVEKNLAKFESKLQTYRWIAYEPINFDRLANKIYIPEDDLKTELDTLLKNGFKGIITFSNEGSLNNIPEIAKKLDSSICVIMGVMDVENKGLLDSAIKVSKYVDAYCVGHMFTDQGINQDSLIEAIKTIRNKTNKPVSTTLRPNGYKCFPDISAEIDWFFPDVHANWYNEDSIEVIIDQTKAIIGDIENLRLLFPNKPFLLKMISFPSNASTNKQYKFFYKITEYSKTCMTFPERVYPSFFSAYDLKWKSTKNYYNKFESQLGLFDSFKVAKTTLINGKKVKVIEGLQWTRK